jgi:hypothetical protein
MGAAALVSLVIEIVENVPQLVHGAAEALEAAKQLWSIATEEAAPSEEELARYTAALDAAHDALQGS